MKAVQLLVNSFLPEDARDYSQTFDAKSLNNTLYNIATNHPDKFADALKSISDIGRKASYYQGETINLKDLESPIDKQTIFAHMDAEIAQLPPEERNGEKKLAIFQKYNELIQKMTQEIALANRNNIAMTILSGARGKNPQLKAMITTPGTFSDYKGRVIPVFSKESFAEGIRPAVFLASTYGARSSVISTKCLGEDTLVRMGDLSVKKIQDIKVGDFVLGSDKSGRVFPVKVLNTFDQGEKECYKYDFNFSNGFMEKSSVVCTEDHKFLMVSAREYGKKRSAFKRGKGEMPTWEDRNKLEIVKAGKMRRGSRASVYNPLYPQGGYSGKKEEPWARIIGLLIGDGSLTCNGRITLSCADTLLIGDIEQELTDLGHKINKVKGDNYSWSITQLNYNAANNSSIVKGVSGFVKGNLNPRNAMLKSYGLLNHYAWEKRFPLGWDTWSKESVAKLIAGLFAADGSVFKTTQSTGRTQVGISFAVTSAELIKDLKLALSVYFGITAREEREVVKGGFGSTTELRVHPLYTLEIARSEDVLKFRDCFLEYIPGIKNFKLSNLCSYVDIKQHNPYAKHMFMRKECVGKIHCFDIEVDHPDHLFVLANGLITSNSATAKGGDFSKQLASTAADMVIRKNDCGTSNGIEIDIDDKSLKGRALAKDTKGIPAGTFITRDIIDRLRKSGVEHVVARSPLTCAVENGLCAHCVGKFYKGGKLPKIGDSIGLVASSVVGEPIAQGALCLEENTLVRMADGSEKKIKDIVPGEYVVGSDKSANTFPVRVLDVFDQGYKDCFRYEIDSRSVVCTPDHKFLIGGNLTRIGESEKPKDNVGETHCYDIEVDHPDHLFVLANGLITSNSAKHTAGMSTGKKSYSGLEYIAQFTQSPEEFRDRAPVTDEDGIVESIEEAPQGGTYITVNGKKYYAGLGHEVLVSQGQTLEAGDQLAEGLVDPEDIVRTKGLGAGMLYYAKRLNKMLEDSSAGTDKRNTEVLARATMRHVKVDSNDGIGSYLPDDVVDYRALMKTYTPPETSRVLKPSDAVGKYLQKPVLHYTIGTRITPSVAKDIETNEYNEVLVDDEQPQFSPIMVRLRAASHTNPDWLASMSTSYLAKQLNESSTRGDDTNILHNTDFRPRLAVGAKFGENVRETGEF